MLAFVRRPLSVAAAIALIGGAGLPVLASAINAAPAGATAPGPIVYSAVPATLAGNYPSVGFEATSTAEFGDEVGPTLQGVLRTARVVMSSWGCQTGGWNTNNCSTTSGATFTHPITFNVYAVNNAGPTPVPGALLMTKTVTQTLPYRPSADNTHCTGGNAGKWFSVADNTCYNGFASTISFDMTTATGPGVGQNLPAQVIWTVAYNTTHYGANPIGPAACGSNCPYDSLNVGVSGTANTGTDVDPDGAFFSSTWAGAYCDNGAGGTGTLRLDHGAGTPCGAGNDWTGFTPMASLQISQPSISASSISVPEGSSGVHNVTVPVSLDQAYPGIVTVQWHTKDGSAKAGTDYTASSGTVSFAAGSTTPSAPLTVPVNGDTTAERYERFQVVFSTPTNGSIATPAASVTLENDDLPTAMVVNSPGVVQGRSAKVKFRINLKRDLPTTINLALIPGSAVQGVDYPALGSPTAVIPAGATSVLVLVPTLVEHTGSDPAESFQLQGTVAGSSPPVTTSSTILIAAHS